MCVYELTKASVRPKVPFIMFLFFLMCLKCFWEPLKIFICNSDPNFSSYVQDNQTLVHSCMRFVLNYTFICLELCFFNIFVSHNNPFSIFSIIIIIILKITQYNFNLNFLISSYNMEKPLLKSMYTYVHI